MPRRSSKKAHQFGGRWTARKLEVIGGYLHSYGTALQDKPSSGHPFKRAYIDGFAGTGSRIDSANWASDEQPSLFAETEMGELEAGLLDGSAQIALKVQPEFDRYIFIERDPERCNDLESLREKYPHLSSRIVIQPGDANTAIQSLCAKHWHAHRAVLFLDPYGMQVEWNTIEAIAATKAIDLWLLFPLGIAVNRMVTRSGLIAPPWRERLNILLGDESWYEEFYRVEPRTDLFGDQQDLVTRVSMDVIGARFVRRLQGLFPGVATSPGVLRTPAGRPLYLLCFAAANAAGAPIAVRIAGTLLKKLP